MAKHQPDHPNPSDPFPGQKPGPGDPGKPPDHAPTGPSPEPGKEPGKETEKKGSEGPEEDEPAQLAALPWLERVRKLVGVIQSVLDALPQAQSHAGASGQGDAQSFSELERQLQEAKARAEQIIQRSDQTAGQSPR